MVSDRLVYLSIAIAVEIPTSHLGPRMLQMSCRVRLDFVHVSFAPGDLLLPQANTNSRIVSHRLQYAPPTLNPPAKPSHSFLLHHTRLPCDFLARLTSVPPLRQRNRHKYKYKQPTSRSGSRFCQYGVVFVRGTSPPFIQRLVLNASIGIAMHSRSMADHALRNTELRRRLDQEETRPASQPVSRRLLHLP
jgi:hypothetical protein